MTLEANFEKYTNNFEKVTGRPIDKMAWRQHIGLKIENDK